ncbi:MAG: DUF4230 domain-containing protein [Blastocatellia bacterium]
MNKRYARPRRVSRDVDEGYDDRYDDGYMDYGQKGTASGGRFWKLLALISVAVAALASYAFISGKGVYDYFTPQAKVVQTATTTLLKMDRESQLVTTRAYVQAVVKQRDEQWYGNAEIVRIVPATIHYAVNLAEIDREKLEYDEQSRTLHVPLPDVKILSIDPDLTKAETIRNVDMLRSEGLTGNVLEDATEKMVRPTLEELGKSPDIIKSAKDQAVMSVRQLLESALDAVGLDVRVKPYFRSEGKVAPRDPRERRPSEPDGK